MAEENSEETEPISRMWKGKWFSLLIDSAVGCNLDVCELDDLSRALSTNIHWELWSGPNVKIVASDLRPEYTCFIQKLTNYFGFQTDIS